MVLTLLKPSIWADGMVLFCLASGAMIITGKSLWDAKITSDQWHNQKNLEATDHSWGKLMEQKATRPI